MRHPDELLDNVEIVEPPLEELTRKGSFFKQTCLTGCGCIVVLVIACVVGIRIFLGSGPKTHKTIPMEFPTNIPLYDKDAIETITVIPGKYEKRSIELALFFPKIILSPLSSNTSTTRHSLSDRFETYFDALQHLWQEGSIPPDAYGTTITIEWHSLEAAPEFIAAYYTNELKKRNFTIIPKTEDKNNLSFSFTGPKIITGTFSAEKQPKGISGTAYATLSITVPHYNGVTANTSSTLIQTHDQTFTSPSL